MHRAKTKVDRFSADAAQTGCKWAKWCPPYPVSGLSSRRLLHLIALIMKHARWCRSCTGMPHAACMHWPSMPHAAGVPRGQGCMVNGAVCAAQPSASMWRRSRTTTSSSRCGTWAGRRASGPTGAATTPTPRCARPCPAVRLQQHCTRHLPLTMHLPEPAVPCSPAVLSMRSFIAVMHSPASGMSEQPCRPPVNVLLCSHPSLTGAQGH